MAPTTYETQNLMRTRVIAGAMVLAGIAGWMYNWHLERVEGHFYIKLCVFAPLAVFGGIMMMIRPQWAGPWRTDSSRGHKVALLLLIATMAIVSGADMYALLHGRIAFASAPAIPTLAFMDRTYRLASVNQTEHRNWEFVCDGDQINDWKTLITVVDRSDAKTREDLDRLAQGLRSSFKLRNAQILKAQTMVENGMPFNYMVAAFNDGARQRYEFDFVKMALTPKGAVVTMYGARVTHAQASEFLDRQSSGIGRALGAMPTPEVTSFPARSR